MCVVVCAWHPYLSSGLWSIVIHKTGLHSNENKLLSCRAGEDLVYGLRESTPYTIGEQSLLLLEFKLLKIKLLLYFCLKLVVNVSA